LLVWWEKKEAIDPSQRANDLFKLRNNDDISQDEIRAEYGFAPDEDRNQSVLGKSAAQAMKTLELLGAGTITEEQAQITLEAMGLPTDVAEKMSKPPEKKEEPAEGSVLVAQGTLPGVKPPPGGKSPEENKAAAGAAAALESAVSYLRMSPKKLADQIVDSSRGS